MNGFYNLVEYLENNPFYIDGILIKLVFKHCFDLKAAWLILSMGGGIHNTTRPCVCCNMKCNQRGIKTNYAVLQLQCPCGLCDGTNCSHWAVNECVPALPNTILRHNHIPLCQCDVKTIEKEELINNLIRFEMTTFNIKGKQVEVGKMTKKDLIYSLQEWYNENIVINRGSIYAKNCVIYASEELVSTNLKFRGFPCHVDDTNLFEKKNFLNELIMEEEEYSRSKRWHNVMRVIKDIKKIVPDELHYQNRTSEKLLTLLFQLVVKLTKTQAAANVILDIVVEYINTVCLGTVECPAYFNINCKEGKVEKISETNGRLILFSNIY